MPTAVEMRSAPPQLPPSRAPNVPPGKARRSSAQRWAMAFWTSSLAMGFDTVVRDEGPRAGMRSLPLPRRGRLNEG